MKLSTWIVALALGAGACTQPESAATETSGADLDEASRPPALPESWGGADEDAWRPEAVIANAASRALNEAWSHADTHEAIVAIPVRMLTSDLYPYGDGQSNAAPSFEGWPEKRRPPLVATLTKTAGGSRVTLRFDRTLPVGSTTIEIGTDTIDAVRSDDGDLVATWTPPAELGATPLYVRPRGWNDAFAIRFDHPVTSEPPASSLLDRERVADRGQDAGTVDARLRARSFSRPYNGHAAGGPIAPYVVDDVHARFPSYGRVIVTGVGRGYTWVADDRPQGFKLMYQCFDGRQPDLETGVPSASGWHRIGDPAETVVNDLERAPMLVGHARPAMSSASIAWGLGDVVTVRWLEPGEALVTARGEFHWFAFFHARRTCAEIVVSPEGAP